MAAYSFDSITSAQALAYNSATDTVSFPSGVTAASLTIFRGGAQTIVTAGGHSVTFGAGFTGQTGATFGDGSRLFLGGSGAAAFPGGAGRDLAIGGEGADNLAGGDGNDSLKGGFGDDQLHGGKGVDTIEGGDGADTFIVHQGDTVVSIPDVIADWSSDDRIQINNSAGAYQETSAPDAGRTHANSLIAAGARYVAVQTPQGVIVYIDTAGDGGAAEDAVLLAGRTLDDISGVNLGAASTLPSAPMGPPETSAPPPTPPSTASEGPDVLAGGAGHDTINGLGGDDSLAGAAGNDALRGDGGADTLDGGAGADTLSGGPGTDRFVVGVGESGTNQGAIDQLNDFDIGETLVLGGGNLLRTIVEISGPLDFATALAQANTRIASGEANFVVIRFNGDTYVFADSRNDNGQADDAVLVDTLGGFVFSTASLVGLALPPPEPETPRAPGIGFSPAARGTIQGDMDAAHLSRLLGLDITEANMNELEISGPGAYAYLGGFLFTFDGNDQITGGNVGAITYREMSGGVTTFSIQATHPGFSASPLGAWVQLDQTQLAFATILAGNDAIRGGPGADQLRVFAGFDFLEGGGGNDTLWGGDGGDIIFAGYSPVQGPPPGQGPAPAGSTYLRGEDGGDIIYGGAGFDDINGNMGNDLCVGGDGDDWVVGGKDNDQLFGEGGNDLVYGNLGADTCVAGAGNDIVRGGQDNDLLWGGAGEDYVSGDRGDDTVQGGAGADLFHSFGDAGIDRVLDFNLSQGDRVLLDPGTQFTVSQVGADTVVDMTGGGKVILVGVQMSSLTPGWIFGA